MERMLIVINSLATGGAERVVVNYANWVVNHTKTQVYICLYEKKTSLYELDERVNVINLNLGKNKLKNLFMKFIEIKKVISKNKIDLVFTVFPKEGLNAFFCKKKSTALVISERNNFSVRPKKDQRILKFLSRVSDGIIFQTNEGKCMYPKNCWKKSVVIPNAISNGLCYEISHEKTRKINTITAMGRLHDQKGFDVLIKAFSIVHKKYPNYKLMIFGEGEKRNELQKLIDNFKLNDYIFLKGNCKTAIKEIAKSKVFVLSSRYEGMPNALMEAMAVGTACISTDCKTGPLDLIENEKNGILVPVDDVEKIALSIQKLLDNDDLRRKIEENSVEILTTNHPDLVYGRYYEYMVSISNKKE